ncbi:MAG: response regulator [Chloroflexota bacterium]
MERDGAAGRYTADAFARRLLLVEDQALMRDLLTGALEQRGFHVTAVASAVEAVRIAVGVDPDGAVLDIDLGAGPDGVALAHALLDRLPHLAIVFLTDAADPRVAAAGPLPRGSTVAWLGKSRITDLERLVAAVEATLTDAASARYRDDERTDRPLAALSRTQMEVLGLAAAGLSNLAIAEARSTSERSVERVLASAYAELGVDASPRTNQRVAAVARYLAAGGRPVTPQEARRRR